eukprot:TRINITY_DN25655_c0_g1_i1.p1 TRINITY_DN25655_c0_g1~~TRINITY_DN25655_c0_g1_i1.p1  ORF type:complete len:134 (-),score=43.34 TRINITY_DN25655_c0_g1_i1:197-550(-)
MGKQWYQRRVHGESSLRSPVEQTCAHNMSSSKEQPQEPTIEDCSDDEDVYYSNNNNNNTCNNNNNDCEDANNNNNNTTHPFHKLGDRPLNIQVTAKVLFGSVSAISALNAERKKKPS